MKKILMVIFSLIIIQNVTVAQVNSNLIEKSVEKYLYEIITKHKNKKEIIILEKKQMNEVYLYTFRFREHISVIDNRMSYYGDFGGMPLMYVSNNKNTRIDASQLKELRKNLDNKVEYGQVWLEKQPKYIEDKDKNGNIVKIPINYEGDFVKGGSYIVRTKNGQLLEAYQEQ